MKYLLNIAFLFCCLPLFVIGQTNSKQFTPLQEASEKTNSTGVIVLEKGKTVFDYHEGSTHKMLNTMSMTKSVVALAITKLLSENQIDSLNVPVSHYYPEWKQGQKENITLRHLMNHTSGLQNVPSARKEIHPSPDILQLALCASVVDTPGTKWSYNNKAVNILSGIVEKASGEKTDKYLERAIFKPLGITDYKWKTDRAGNHYAMSGLALRPDDMAKLGQLVLQKGAWNGQELIAEKWIEEMLSQATPLKKSSGLLWFRIFKNSKLVIDGDLINDLKKAGLKESWIKKVQAIKGSYKNQDALTRAYMSQFSKMEFVNFRQTAGKKEVKLLRDASSGPVIGYQSKGWLGQRLVIYPKFDIVAVRMVKPSKDYNQKTDSFGNFSDLIYKLAARN